MNESCRPQRVRPIPRDTVIHRVPLILRNIQDRATGRDPDRVPLTLHSIRDRELVRVHLRVQDPRTPHKTQDPDREQVRVLLRDPVPLRVPRTLLNTRLISHSW